MFVLLGRRADVLHPGRVLPPRLLSPVSQGSPAARERFGWRTGLQCISPASGPRARESPRGGLGFLLLIVRNGSPVERRGPEGRAFGPVTRRVAKARDATSARALSPTPSRALALSSSTAARSPCRWRPHLTRGKPGAEKLVGLCLPGLLGTESRFEPQEPGFTFS